MMKVLVISILIAALLLFICAMMKTGIIARHFKKNTDNSNAKTDDSESTKQLCSCCKTGKTSFELDKHSENCPYIDCLKDGECKFYVPF